MKFDQSVEQHWGGQRGQSGQRDKRESQRRLATGSGGKNVPTSGARLVKHAAQPISAMSSTNDDSYFDADSSYDSTFSDP